MRHTYFSSIPAILLICEPTYPIFSFNLQQKLFILKMCCAVLLPKLYHSVSGTHNTQPILISVSRTHFISFIYKNQMKHVYNFDDGNKIFICYTRRLENGTLKCLFIIKMCFKKNYVAFES